MPPPTFVASPLGPLTYTLTVSIPRPYQPALTVQTSVTFSMQAGGAPVVVEAATGTQLCQNSRVLLTATGGDGVTYVWSPATGLSSTTGAQVFASPDATINYTVSSGCGDVADIILEVQEDCCPYNFYLNNGVAVTELDHNGTYFSSPFDPRALVYHANGDLRLEADTYTLPPGGVLLLDEGATLTLASHAEFIVDRATVTATCEDMWQAVRVLADAQGIRTTGSSSAPALVAHGWEGIVLEEPDGNNPTPTFQFTHTHFLHNRQSLAFYRDATAARTGDAITNCLFDSDPAAFKGPWNNPAPEQRHYAERHIYLAGQLLPATVEHNDFRHCYYAIYTPERDVTQASIRVFESTFSDFYLAGIHSNRGAGQVPQVYEVENCIFTFPAGATLPPTEQTEELLPTLYFSTVHTVQPIVPATFGMHFGDNSPVLTALGNRFQQLDSTSVQMSSYDDFGQVRPRQTGIYCVAPYTIDGNRFYLLDTGLYLQYVQDMGSPWNPPQVSIRANGFVHCREGLGIVPGSIKTGSGVTNELTLQVTCNTFRRDDQRTGTTLGIHQYQQPNSGGQPSYLPTVRLDDLSNNASPRLLKNYFDDQNGNVNGQYYALVNDQGGPALVYNTFGSPSFSPSVNKAVYISNLSAGNLSIQPNNPSLTPSLNPAPGSFTGREPCYQDGIPHAGLQQRGTNSSPGATSAPASSKVDALNYGYPNPTPGRITFTYQLKADNAKAELLVRRAVDGCEVQRVALSGEGKEHVLNLSDQPASTYFVTLLVNQVPVSTRRVVVSQTGR